MTRGQRQWNAYVEAGKDRKEQVERYKEAPEEYQEAAKMSDIRISEDDYIAISNNAKIQAAVKILESLIETDSNSFVILLTREFMDNVQAAMKKNIEII